MREPGYYWVKYDSEWEVAEFATFHTPEFGGPYGWFRTAFPDVFTNSDFEEIDERRIKRQPSINDMFKPDPNPVEWKEELKPPPYDVYISDNPYLCKNDE